MARHVINLDSRSAVKPDLTGGKGASLALLRRRNYPVPPGFVITSRAFDDVALALSLEVRPQYWSGAELAACRKQLVSCDIPRRLLAAVREAHLRLDGPVAVRSSMIGEDSQLSSFAGQLDTILNVCNEQELVAAIRQCWASVFNTRLAAYFRERECTSGDDGAGSCSTAVVVQRMVDALAAGVAFSADPTTGQRCVLVEATRGLGDALVSGRVTPDRYLVDGRGELAEVHPADGEPVLQPELILELAALVRAVARDAGTPQDVEWAWDGACLWLLQSRPITTLVGKHIYSNRISSEMAPGLIKPLLYSTNTTSMARNAFGRVFTELIGENDIDFSTLGKRIHSRQYTDLTVMGELFERVGLPPNFTEMMSRDESGERRRPKMSPKMMLAGLRLLRFAIRYGRVAGEIEAYNRRHDEELEAFRRTDWSGMPTAEIIARFDDLARMHGETQWHVFIGPVNMLIRNRHIASLVRRHAPGVAPGDLIKGLVGLKALEPNARLSAMAARTRQLGDEFVHVIATGEDREIRSHLAGWEAGRALAYEVDAFLDEYGFLSTNGTDFTVAPWAETPTLIWRAIGRTALGPALPATKDGAAIRDRARARVRSQLNPLLRVHFDRLLRTTIQYIDLRERTSMLMSEDAYQMRRIFLEIGKRLVDGGDLAECDDVFYLEYSELRELVDRRLDPHEARCLVSSRRAEMAADAEIELPDTICGDVVSTTPISLADGTDFLVGIGGSRGIAQGMARVINDPAEAPASLTREDILVVPFTDVGWTPLFAGIGGIVAETGGMLSHTAIVAREYGLPAVVSVKKATRLIQHGQTITVDGNSGRVHLNTTVED
jgi:pyruvate,water dikinase